MMDKSVYAQVSHVLSGTLKLMEASKQFQDGIAIGNVSVALLRALPDKNFVNMTNGVLKHHDSSESKGRQLYALYLGVIKSLESYCEAKSKEGV